MLNILWLLVRSFIVGAFFGSVPAVFGLSEGWITMVWFVPTWVLSGIFVFPFAFVVFANDDQIRRNRLRAVMVLKVS